MDRAYYLMTGTCTGCETVNQTTQPIHINTDRQTDRAVPCRWRVECGAVRWQKWAQWTEQDWLMQCWQRRHQWSQTHTITTHIVSYSTNTTTIHRLSHSSAAGLATKHIGHSHITHNSSHFHYVQIPCQLQWNSNSATYYSGTITAVKYKYTEPGAVLGA